MKVTKKSGAINKIREDGTDITHYIFKEYEVHYTFSNP